MIIIVYNIGNQFVSFSLQPNNTEKRYQKTACGNAVLFVVHRADEWYDYTAIVSTFTLFSEDLYAGIEEHHQGLRVR